MNIRVPFRFWHRAFRAVLLGLAVCGAGVWLWPLAAGLMVHVDTIRPDNARSVVKLSGLLVRDETVVYAPANGFFQPQLAEGARVSRGGMVGLLKGLDSVYEVRALRGGVVFYRMDGLEQVLTPDAGPGLIQPPKVTLVSRTAGDSVARGEAVFKIVDNLDPVYVQFTVPGGLLPREMVVSGARWRLVWSNEVYSGRISDLLPGDGQTLVRLKVQRYPPDFLDGRRQEVGVITRELNGFIVPRRAIALLKDRPGLVTLHNEDFRWLPVTIEGQTQRHVQVSGKGVTAGLRYVTNPWLLPEKERMIR